jgi:hypothetical protein
MYRQYSLRLPFIEKEVRNLEALAENLGIA